MNEKHELALKKQALFGKTSQKTPGVALHRVDPSAPVSSLSENKQKTLDENRGLGSSNPSTIRSVNAGLPSAPPAYDDVVTWYPESPKRTPDRQPISGRKPSARDPNKSIPTIILPVGKRRAKNVDRKDSAPMEVINVKPVKAPFTQWLEEKSCIDILQCAFWFTLDEFGFHVYEPFGCAEEEGGLWYLQRFLLWLFGLVLSPLLLVIWIFTAMVILGLGKSCSESWYYACRIHFTFSIFLTTPILILMCVLTSCQGESGTEHHESYDRRNYDNHRREYNAHSNYSKNITFDDMAGMCDGDD